MVLPLVQVLPLIHAPLVWLFFQIDSGRCHIYLLFLPS